jgi:hemoglobin
VSEAGQPTPVFGLGDASFRAAGGEAGIRRLVDAFYDAMDTQPGAAAVRAMHPRDLSMSRDKLARFLCGWLNGPNLYREKYGPISIPGVHAHLTIRPAERDAWLNCMERAIASQAYSAEFKQYLYAQLCVPANRVVNHEGGMPSTA